MKIRKLDEHIEDDSSKKSKILQLLQSYKVDFSNREVFTPVHSPYRPYDYGIREEDFESLADEIEQIFKPDTNHYPWEFRHFNKK
jgi:hypothetical protein